MTREELTKQFLDSKASSYILQLPTSYGKTKLALQKIETWFDLYTRILIVVPRWVLKDTWLEQIAKWGNKSIIDNITFTTYISLPKFCGESWDVVVLDEAHHTSERCQEAMVYLRTKHLLALSATLKKETVRFLIHRFKATVFNVKIREAIEDEVLPNPKVLLIPLALNNKIVNQVIEKNIKKNNTKTPVTINFSEKWKFSHYKFPLRILCTQQQYYNDISGLIDWYKDRSAGNAIMKNLWLHTAGKRLKWLAEQKQDVVKELLKELKNYRCLIFCQSIEQSENLGCPCVNSKRGTENLDKFNAKKIKHIASVDMLNEGLNPIDCKIGLFQMINSSQRISLQRIGRVLRHKEPVLIFPYWINTREEEIMNEILKDYNKDLVISLSRYSIPQVKNYL